MSRIPGGSTRSRAAATGRGPPSGGGGSGWMRGSKLMALSGQDGGRGSQGFGPGGLGGETPPDPWPPPTDQGFGGVPPPTLKSRRDHGIVRPAAENVEAGKTLPP